MEELLPQWSNSSEIEFQFHNIEQDILEDKVAYEDLEEALIRLKNRISVLGNTKVDYHAYMARFYYLAAENSDKFGEFGVARVRRILAESCDEQYKEALLHEEAVQASSASPMDDVSHTCVEAEPRVGVPTSFRSQHELQFLNRFSEQVDVVCQSVHAKEILTAESYFEAKENFMEAYKTLEAEMAQVLVNIGENDNDATKAATDEVNALLLYMRGQFLLCQQQFMVHIAGNPADAMACLFHDGHGVMLALDVIKQRYKKLLLEFHPDKISLFSKLDNLQDTREEHTDMETALQAELEGLAPAMVSIINGTYRALDKVHKAGGQTAEFFIEKAESFKKEALACQNAKRSETPVTDLSRRPDTELLHMQCGYALAAFKNYRLASMLLDEQADVQTGFDKTELLFERTHLRVQMAEMLYLSSINPDNDQLIEAHLYALSAQRVSTEIEIKARLDNYEKVCALRKSARDIIDKIRKKLSTDLHYNHQHEMAERASVVQTTTAEDGTQTEPIEQVAPSAARTEATVVRPLSRDLVCQYSQALSTLIDPKPQSPTERDEKNYADNVQADLRELSVVLLSADRRLADPRASVGSLENAEQRVAIRRDRAIATVAVGVTGGLVGIGVIGGGAALATSLIASIATGSAIGTIFAPPFGTIIGGIIGGVGAFSVLGAASLATGVTFKEQYYSLTQAFNKKETLHTLNDLIGIALVAYSEAHYLKFIRILSRPAGDAPLIGIRFSDDGQCVEEISVEPKEIIRTMLDCGFRPEGIAYLLNMIAEVLYSHGDKLGQPDHDDIYPLVRKIYRELVKPDNALFAHAKMLDEKLDTVEDARLNRRGIEHMNKVRRWFVHMFYGIDKEYFEKEEKNPFEIRLEEVVNVARINLILVLLLHSSRLSGKAKGEILDIRSKLKITLVQTKVFVSASENRFNAVEDYLRLFIDIPPETVTAEADNEGQLMLCDRPYDTKEELLFRRADVFRGNEESADSGQYLSELCEQVHTMLQFARREVNDGEVLEAKKFYHKALELINGIIGHKGRTGVQLFMMRMECLLGLSKHSLAHKALSIPPSDCVTALRAREDFWVMKIDAARHIGDYERAYVAAKRAARLFPASRKIENKHNRLRDRIEENKKSTADLISEKVYQSSFARTCSSPRQSFNVLSIDGGGIRGIIPAIVLAKLEKVTSLPICKIFDLQAGTSTGGIISTLLSLPVSVGSETPKFSAGGVLNLYVERARDIFGAPRGRLWRLVGSKHSREGAERVVREACEINTGSREMCYAKLSHALTELAIPAVPSEHRTQTTCFTRSAARRNQEYDYHAHDVLLATSAAPTFFPPYNLAGEECYVDGGVNMNNPCLKAYTIANELLREKSDDRPVKVLSLGTGAYVPDPLNYRVGHGLLFWGVNIAGTVMGGQENNVHRQMRAQLGDEQYIRVQNWMEGYFPFDTCESEDIRRLVEIGETLVEDMEERSEFNAIERKFCPRQ